MQSGQTAAPVSPIQKLQQDFDQFAKIYQVLTGMVHGFPLDIIDKKVIVKDFLNGFGYAQNLLMAIAQQAQAQQAAAAQVAAQSGPVPASPVSPAPAAPAASPEVVGELKVVPAEQEAATA